MSTQLKVLRMAVQTDTGVSSLDFRDTLTVLAGPVGVGKSTLLELLRFALGGRLVPASVVTDHVKGVSVELLVDGRRLTLARSTDQDELKTVSVVDQRTSQLVGNLNVDGKDPSLGKFLLASMGLPIDAKAASRASNSTKQGATISFNDIIRFFYVPQSEINQDIANSSDSWYAPKRVAVFELLFGLIDEQILELQSLAAQERQRLTEAQAESGTVQRFLEDSKAKTRLELEISLDATRGQIQASTLLLEGLRSGLEPVIDRETDNLRLLLQEVSSEIGAIEIRQQGLRQSAIAYREQLANARTDIERLERLEIAGERIAIIEFSRCPRCLQALNARPVPQGHCLLCTQVDEGEAVAAKYVETERALLDDRVTEAARLLDSTESENSELNDLLDLRRKLVADLSDEIDRRTADLVSPRLRAFEDAASALAEARERVVGLEHLLFQWDRADDLERIAIERKAALDQVTLDLDRRMESLSVRRREIISEISSEFDAIVQSIGIQGVTQGGIDDATYLPTLNGKLYSKFSPAGGGIRTTTQIAYWLAVHTVALRRNDTAVPSLLVLDSPRLSLNNADDMARAVYRRIVTLADAYRDRIQILIADNELPVAYRSDYTQINFDFDNPTIRGVPHPGPDKVQTLKAVKSP